MSKKDIQKTSKKDNGKVSKKDTRKTPKKDKTPNKDLKKAPTAKSVRKAAGAIVKGAVRASVLEQKAEKIRLLLTDVDGVLTDNGVYYSERGEEMKRFSIRDGMGVERLRKLAKIDTGFVTGEISPAVSRRAEKLAITELHPGVKDKLARLEEILFTNRLQWEEIAYIGDDVNDLEVLQKAGISACPADAMPAVKTVVDFHCEQKGGYGAFREFAEWLIAMRGREKK